MIAALLLLAALAPVVRAEGPRSDAAPSYSEASLANAATRANGPFAPYVVATLYGTNLARDTLAAPSAGSLPIELAGVHVVIGTGEAGISAGLYFVSPSQINFVIPDAPLGPSQLIVVRQGASGPPVKFTLQATAPALFPRGDSSEPLATHADFSLIGPDTPAHPGEIVILWATGLGNTLPPPENFRWPSQPAGLKYPADLRVLLAGQALDAGRILYAGAAPGLAGLYQINLRLPDQVEPDPEIRLEMAGQTSPPGVVLRCR